MDNNTSETKEELPPIKIIGDQLYEEYKNTVFTYDKPIGRKAVKREHLSAKWMGEKFPYEQWKKIIGFFVTSFTKTKAESIVRMYYNADTKEWKTHAFPQEYSGLAVTDTTDDAQFLKYIGDGFVLAATAHHHCDISAFQSGQDGKDEETKAGVHITVGDLDKETMDFHCRISIGKKMYESSIFDFVDIPLTPLEGMELTDEFIASFKVQALCQTQSFPKVWLDNIKQKVYTPPPSVQSSYYSENEFDRFDTNYLGQKHQAGKISDRTKGLSFTELEEEVDSLEIQLEDERIAYAEMIDNFYRVVNDPTVSDSDKVSAFQELLDMQPSFL